MARDVNAGEHEHCGGPPIEGKNNFLCASLFFTLNVGQIFMYYISCELGSCCLHP